MLDIRQDARLFRECTGRRLHRMLDWMLVSAVDAGNALHIRQFDKTLDRTLDVDIGQDTTLDIG